MSVERLSTEHKKSIADSLCHLLADTYTLYLKTLNFHWNVTGPQFSTLHLLFEGQYTELAAAVDEIAERIRALGHPAPASYSAYAKLAKVKEATDHPTAHEMIKRLNEDQHIVCETANKVFKIASQHDDQATADLATRRLQIHEKTAWMLKSMI